jgi:hypothetical protein
MGIARKSTFYYLINGSVFVVGGVDSVEKRLNIPHMLQNSGVMGWEAQYMGLFDLIYYPHRFVENTG